MAESRTLWLVEITAYSDDLAGAATLRYASHGGFMTKPADSPANTFFPPRVLDPGSFERSVYTGAATGGLSTVGYGVVELNNADGGLDGLRAHGYGRAIAIKSITTTNGADPAKRPYSEAVTRLSGICDRIEFSTDSAFAVLRDALADFDVPYMDATFAGTSTSTTGIEGNVNVEGLPKPAVYGTVVNITPALANASNQIYAFNHAPDGTTLPVASIPALRNGGATYTLSGTNRADLSALESNTPPSAEADTCIAESLFRCNGSVTAGLTVDVFEAASVENKALRSEELDNASWTKTGASVSANAATAPDGNATGDKLVEDGSAGNHVASQAITISAGATVAFACYVLADTSTKGRLAIEGASGSLYLDFDAGAGTIGTATASGGYSGASAPTVEAAGDWYRIEIRGTTATDTSATAKLYLANASAAISYTGDGASGLYWWGAQFVAGSEAGPYIKTTSAAASRRAKATPARIVQRILAAKGKSIDAASVLALDAKAPYEAGIYITAPGDTVLDICNRVLASVGGYLIASRAGAYAVGRFEAPSGAAVATITADRIVDGEGGQIEVLPPDDPAEGRAIHEWIVGYSPRWTVQLGGDLSGSVSQDDRSKWGRPFLEVADDDAAVLTKHPRARSERRDTALASATDAEAEAARLLALYAEPPFRLRVPVPSVHVPTIDIMDPVTITLARWGLSAGVLFSVVRIDERFADEITYLDVVKDG